MSVTHTPKKRQQNLTIDGNMGVGTTNPSARLNVVDGDVLVSGGTNRLAMGDTAWGMSHADGDGTLYINGWGNAACNVFVHDTKTGIDRVSFGLDTGYVGIGKITGLTDYLTVKETAKIISETADVPAQLTIEQSHVGTGSDEAILKIKAENGSYVKLFNGSDVQKGVLAYDSDVTDVVFLGYGASTNHITVNSSGNVGIGKANQTKKLDVAGDINSDGAVYAAGANISALTTIDAALATPLIIKRNNGDNTVNLKFEHTTLSRYLGITAAGTLMFGPSANLPVDGYTIYHSNNFTDNHVNWDAAYTHSQSAHSYLPLAGGTVTGATTFSGTLTGTLTGNASTATKLATARTINGVSFDGSANITVADATKLPLTGGTLSGTLNFGNGANINLTYGGFNRTAITSNGGDTNGISIEIGAGARTIVGSGESASLVASNTTGTSETLYLSSDGVIEFHTALQNGWASRKTMTFSVDGDLSVPNNITASGGGSINWNTAYTHSQAAHAPSTAQANADITKAEIEAKLTGDISSHRHDSIGDTNIQKKLWHLSSGSGGASFKLGNIQLSSSNDGSIDFTIHFAYDYGNSETGKIIGTFSQRTGNVTSCWEKYGEFNAEPVYLELIDDGAGNLEVWATATDYCRTLVEASIRHGANWVSSGIVSSSTKTSGTPLCDTRNAATTDVELGSVNIQAQFSIEYNATEDSIDFVWS